MYAHPAFARGQPETLSQLRKCNSSGAKKSLLPPSSGIAKVRPTPNSPSSVVLSDAIEIARDVSPAAPRTTDFGCLHIAPHPASHLNVFMPSLLMHSQWHHSPYEITTAPAPVSPGGYGSGRLDLLALALKSMAERDSSISGITATVIKTA